MVGMDLTDSDSIGPGKIALLEAIRAEGSIAAAARHLGMSYRRAWLLVESINNGLSEPAVTAATQILPADQSPKPPARPSKRPLVQPPKSEQVSSMSPNGSRKVSSMSPVHTLT